MTSNPGGSEDRKETYMKYLSTINEGNKIAKVEELSKENTRFLLECYYVKEVVDDIFENNKSFRLDVGLRTIWTKTDDGLVPIAGFYGIVG